MYSVKYLVSNFNFKRINKQAINDLLREIACEFNVSHFIETIVIIDGESMNNSIVNEIKEFDTDIYYSCDIKSDCPNYYKCCANNEFKKMFLDENYTTDYCNAKKYGYKNNQQVYNLGINKFLFSQYTRGFYSSNTKEVIINLEEILNTYVDYLAGYLEPMDNGESFSEFNMFDNFDSAISGIMINTIIHEIYHSYQDKHSKEMSCVEATTIAYKVFVDKYLNYIIFKDN